MLGVPSKIKTPDLLQFTAPCQGQLDMMRIITDGSSPNQFMVLLRFRCQVIKAECCSFVIATLLYPFFQLLYLGSG